MIIVSPKGHHLNKLWWAGVPDATLKISRKIDQTVLEKKIFKVFLPYEPRHEKNNVLHMRKTNPQISFSVTEKLISAFVFATWIVQYLFFLNPKAKPLAISSVCTAWFVSDLVRINNVGFLMLRLIYGHGGNPDAMNKFCAPYPLRLHIKFGFDWQSSFREEDVWALWMTDRWMPEDGYTISSPMSLRLRWPKIYKFLILIRSASTSSFASASRF